MPKNWNDILCDKGEKKNICDISSEETTLEGLTTKNSLDCLDYMWHTCHTTHKDDLIPEPSYKGQPSTRQEKQWDSLWEHSSFWLTCCRPLEPEEINGKLISVWEIDESSILAFSAASRICWMAIWSLARSIPISFLNELMMCSTKTIQSPRHRDGYLRLSSWPWKHHFASPTWKYRKSCHQKWQISQHDRDRKQGQRL